MKSKAIKRAIKDAGKKLGVPGPYTVMALYKEQNGKREMIVFKDGNGKAWYVSGTPAPSATEKA